MRYLLNKLKENGYKVTEQTVFKNGVERKAIVVNDASGIGVTLYVDDIKDMPIDKLVDTIEKGFENKPINPKEFFNRSYVFENVLIGLQRKSDEPIIKKDFHGYDQFLYVVMNNGEASYKIKKSMLDALDISEDDLWDKAEINTNAQLDLCAFFNMYYATNKYKVRGAGVITTQQNLLKVKEELKADEIVVIPSSIHEVIVLPSYLADIDVVRQMIKEVNDTVVEENDILGYEPIIL